MSIRVAVVTAGLVVPSSTRLLADQLATATVEAFTSQGVEVSTEVIELRPLARPLADHLLAGFPNEELARAIEVVTDADALIAVTPVFSASYSGLFKTFFDVLEVGALEGTPVLMAATAGTARHSLVLEHALRPLFAYLKTLPVPTAVFAASEDFGATGDGALAQRVQRAGRELARFTSGEDRREVTTPSQEDPFADPVPFSELLARI